MAARQRLVALMVGACLLAVAVPAAAQGAALSLDPEQVDIDMSYGGTTLTVRGQAPAGCGLAVQLVGRRDRLEVKKKGKVGGVLWMTVGDATFENVPTVYRLATSVPLDKLASPTLLRQQAVGYDALTEQVGGDAETFAELIRLKEHEGLFSSDEGAVEVTLGPADRVSFVATFELPARLRAGDYTVKVTGFDDDHVVEVGSATLKVKLAGLAKAMRELAMDRGLLYGCGAVIAAIIAGLITGLIFGRKASQGH